MKIILITLSIFSLFSCKAQITPIYLVDDEIYYDNTYYKDVDNDFNTYEGTWKWEDGNTSLTIIFNKVTNYTDGDGDYYDFLVGEYQFIENGVEKVNSFPEPIINDTNGTPIIVNQDPYGNNIMSYDIRTDKGYFPPCTECPTNTRFILLDISDPTRTKVDGMISMARFIEGGIEKIRARIRTTFVLNEDGNYSGPTSLTIPEGVITLIKIE